MLARAAFALTLAAGLALAALPLSAQPLGGGLDTRFGPNAGHFRYNRETYSEWTSDLAVDSQGRIYLAFLFEDGGGTNWPALQRLTPEGSLDPSFGFLGLWLESVYPAVLGSRVAVAVDGSDRPLVGWTYEYDQGGTPNQDWAVRRLTASGLSDLFKVAAFDLGLGGSGARTDTLANLLLWWDGRVIAVGSAQFSADDYDFAVAVWAPDLSDNLALDPTFDGDGRATVYFDLGGAKTDQVEAVAAHGTGFIVAGWATSLGGAAMAVCRFELLTGALDPSFGTGGKATFTYAPFGGSAWSNQNAFAAVERSGGGLLLAGKARDGGGNEQLTVLALDGTGQVEPSWGVLGWLVDDLRYPGFPTSPTFSGANGVAIDSSGRALVVGWVYHPTELQYRGVALRLTAFGSLDASFSGDGRETYGFEPTGQPNKDWFDSVALVDGGKLAVVGGYTYGVTEGVVRSDWDLAATRIVVDPLLFADGFESGNASAWSSVQP